MFYTLHAEDVGHRGLATVLNEAAIAFVEKQYHTACCKYRGALELISGLNITKNNNEEALVKYMLCESLLELNALEDILQALETLTQLKTFFGNTFPAIYYALGKAYIKLYRFNSALDAVNTGLTILNAKIYFQQFCIPTTSITIKESTKEGLLVALMNLHDEASSWHCPDAKCYMENCQNRVAHCLPSRDIFFKDPALTGLVVVTCNNTNNPCKFKFHKACWDFQKRKICSMVKLSDKEVVGHLCFTSDCKSNDALSIITKVEVFDNHKQIMSAIQKSSPVREPVPNTPVKGAIKKYTQQSFPKLRRPNLPNSSSPQKIEEHPLAKAIENATRMAKLNRLRESNFNVSNGEYLELDKDEHKNKNLDSTTDILPDLAFKDDDVETIQQCRFIFEILHEFIKSNLMVHYNKVLLKWHETKEIMEYVKGIDKFSDLEIMELLLKSPKFIQIGSYICIEETLGHALEMFEREMMQHCKVLLQVESQKGNGDSQPADNEIRSQKTIIDNFENQTNQNSQRPLYSTNNVNGNNNNICPSSNMHETPINFIKINSLNEENTNTLSQSENISDWSIQRSLLAPCIKNEDKMECNTSHKGNPFINSNGIKRNNQNLIDSMEQDGSESSKKYLFSRESANKNILNDKFMEQSQSEEASKFAVLQEKYKQFMTNYSAMEQTVTKLTQEKADMEQNFKLELAKKNSIMEAIIEERKILIKKLEAYESHIAENMPVKYEALNKGILTLQVEVNRLKQEKLDNEHNINVLLNEKSLTENRLEKNNTELSEIKKECQAEIDQKNTELMTFQEKFLAMKKSMLLNSLESQYFWNLSIISQGLKHCQIALETFDNLNYMTKQKFGFDIILNYTTWLQALNCLQAEHTKMEGEFFQYKSMLESKAEVEKVDKIVINSVSLPPYPSRSIGAIICDAFMMFYSHISQIPQQGVPIFTPPPLLLNPHMLTYIHQPNPPNKSDLQQRQKQRTPTKSVNSNVNLDQVIPQLEKKPLENERQKISEKCDLDKENSDLQRTDDNIKVQFNLQDNGNDIDNKKQLKDNQVMTEIKTNEASSTYMINSDVPNTFNENKLVFKSNDASDNTGCTLLSEIKIEEATEEENVKNTEKGSNNVLINSTDKVMNILRNKYSGMSDFSLLKSLNDLRTVYNGKLTGIPLNAIMKNLDKYVLSHQIDHLCTYVESKKTIKNTTTVLKGSKKQSKSKVKKKSSSSSIKLKDVNLTNSSVEHKKGQPSGTIQKEPISLAKSPWGIILKPGTSKSNYEESECVICMENLQAIDKPIYTLDCQHKFHKTCIKEWFQKNQSCPTCRIHCTIDEEYPPLP